MTRLELLEIEIELDAAIDRAADVLDLDANGDEVENDADVLDLDALLATLDCALS